MVKQIGRLSNQCRTVFILGRDDCLGAFLSDFFENLVQSLVEQISRVRILWSISFARGDDGVKAAERSTQISFMAFGSHLFPRLSGRVLEFVLKTSLGV